MKTIVMTEMAFCFVLLSAWKWETITASLGSLLFSISLLFTPSESISFSEHSDLIGFWIASLAWLASAIYLATSIYRLVSSTKNIQDKEKEDRNQWSFFNPLVLFIALYCFIALIAPIIAPFNPTTQGDLRTTRLLPPFETASVEFIRTDEQRIGETSTIQTLRELKRKLLQADVQFRRRDSSLLNQDAKRTFVFGTDELGRDVFSRLLFGMQTSLFIGIVGMCCAVLIGCLVGFLSGMSKGWLDHLCMRLTDLFLAVPSLFLVIILVAFIGNSFFLLIFVLAVTGWMGVARLVRGEIISIREREFVLAARLLGRKSHEIVFTHMIPNVLPTLVVASILQFGNVILAETSLGFLGLGIQPPSPSLGNMIAQSIPYITNGWWLGLFPGIMLSSLLVIINLAAEQFSRKHRNA